MNTKDSEEAVRADLRTQLTRAITRPKPRTGPVTLSDQLDAVEAIFVRFATPDHAAVVEALERADRDLKAMERHELRDWEDFSAIQDMAREAQKRTADALSMSKAPQTGGATSSDGGVESRHAKTGNMSGAAPEAEKNSPAAGFVRASEEGLTSQARAGVAPGPSETTPSSRAEPVAAFDPDCDSIADLVARVPMPTEEQKRVGEMALDDYYNGNKTEGVQECCAHVYRAMAALSTSPLSSRAEVVEECAKIADGVADGQNPVPLAVNGHIVRRTARYIAEAIRASTAIRALAQPAVGRESLDNSRSGSPTGDRSAATGGEAK